MGCFYEGLVFRVLYGVGRVAFAIVADLLLLQRVFSFLRWRSRLSCIHSLFMVWW